MALHSLLKQFLDSEVHKSKQRSHKERLQPWLQPFMVAHLRVVAQEGALLAAAIRKAHIALLHQRLERAPAFHTAWVLTGDGTYVMFDQLPVASCVT